MVSENQIDGEEESVCPKRIVCEITDKNKKRVFAHIDVKEKTAYLIDFSDKDYFRRENVITNPAYKNRYQNI